jgi:4-methylaminobutanoate oxidase (formaldehyde-forming)
LGDVNNEEGVNAEFVESGGYEIEVAGVRYPARASLCPMYDPEGKRVRS